MTATKKIVYYTKSKGMILTLGEKAFVNAPEHPAHNYPQMKSVLTTTVMRHDKISGEFETLNTIYKLKHSIKEKKLEPTIEEDKLFED